MNFPIVLGAHLVPLLYHQAVRSPGLSSKHPSVAAVAAAPAFCLVYHPWTVRIPSHWAQVSSSGSRPVARWRYNDSCRSLRVTSLLLEYFRTSYLGPTGDQGRDLDPCAAHRYAQASVMKERRRYSAGWVRIQRSAGQHLRNRYR